MKKMDKQKGVTLVALVITIIILLILAGISISSLTNSGLFEKAKEAEQKSKEAQEKEEGILADYEKMMNKYLSDAPTIDPSVLALKAGDYVKYDSGTNGVITCRVLYPASSEYGLQIISDKNVEDLPIGGESAAIVSWEIGKAGYNNYIKALNDGAEKYLNTTYAVDARCVGSLPTVDANGNFTQKDKGTETTVSVPTDWTLPSGWTSTDTGCYGEDENYTSDETAMETAGIRVTGEVYWLASRDVDLGGHYCNLSGRIMNYDEGAGEGFEDVGVDYCVICGMTNYGYEEGYVGIFGLRPCFSLKAGVKIAGGDGKTEGTAYTLSF